MTHRDGLSRLSDSVAHGFRCPALPRRTSYPTDRIRDLYGSLSALLGISAAGRKRRDEAVR